MKSISLPSSGPPAFAPSELRTGRSGHLLHIVEKDKKSPLRDPERGLGVRQADGLQHAWLATPIGTLRVTASERGVTGIALEKAAKKSSSDLSKNAALRECIGQLKKYFAISAVKGSIPTLSFPTDLACTPFQKRVWQELLTVPFGQTISYGALAKQVGKPTASRAVGSAVGKNPLGVLVPCHRIVPASGKLPGNFAWGSSRKAWLLKHEAQ